MTKLPSFHFPAGQIGQIMYADNAISRKVCKGLIKECETYFGELFTPGPTLGGVNSLIKNSYDFSMGRPNLVHHNVDSSNFDYFENQISEGVSTAMAHYVQTYEHLWPAPGLRDTGFRIQRYFKNFGFYRTHVDHNPWDSVTDTPYGPRILGIVIYLNDVEVGGSTYFRVHDTHVQARAGRISIFPTNWTHPHEGQTPISSDKWMISTFITAQSMHTPRFDEPASVEPDQGDVVNEKEAEANQEPVDTEH